MIGPMVTGEFLFLEKDLTVLKEIRGSFYRRYRQSAAEAGEACEQSSETFHDNFPYEQAMRDMGMNARRVGELDAVLAKAVIVPIPEIADIVQIGVGVELLDGTTDEILYVEIGSFLVPRINEFEEEGKTPDHPMRISYNSPLAQCLLGARQYEARVLKKNVKLAELTDQDDILTIFKIWIPAAPTPK